MIERQWEMASEEGEMSTISAHDLAREIHSNQVQYSTTISTHVLHLPLHQPSLNQSHQQNLTYPDFTVIYIRLSRAINIMHRHGDA